jgi:D-alanyl-D-alanine carboxypeptidase/D-alanyl-D-alanine-endopeptidase (penicillin-binding protein 4)
VFRTVALAAGRPDPAGNLAGDLVIRGGGDPSLDVGRKEGEEGKIDRLARSIAAAGVRRIGGDLVLDDGRFDRRLRAPGWPSDQLQRPYCAPVTALTVGRGCLTVIVKPGDRPGAEARVETVPASPSLTIDSKVVTTAKKSEHRIILDLPPDGETLTVKGRVWIRSTGFPAEVAAPDPTVLFGEALRRRLVSNGVSLTGRIVRGPGAAAKLGESVELAAVETTNLELIRVTNRESQNLFADCLLKNLGFEATGTGSFAEGSKATNGFAKTLGFPDGHVVQADGSGLSRENRVTPRFLARLLVHLTEREDWNDFAQTLPYGGEPGTSLRNRLKDLGKNLYAKTGTIRAVSGLAGYVRSKSGRVYGFAVLVNDARIQDARKLQDAVCRVLFEEY